MPTFLQRSEYAEWSWPSRQSCMRGGPEPMLESDAIDSRRDMLTFLGVLTPMEEPNDSRRCTTHMRL